MTQSHPRVVSVAALLVTAFLVPFGLQQMGVEGPSSLGTVVNQVTLPLSRVVPPQVGQWLSLGRSRAGKERCQVIDPNAWTPTAAATQALNLPPTTPVNTAGATLQSRPFCKLPPLTLRTGATTDTFYYRVGTPNAGEPGWLVLQTEGSQVAAVSKSDAPNY